MRATHRDFYQNSAHIGGGQVMQRVPKVRTSHHRNKEEAARLQELVAKRYAQAQNAEPLYGDDTYMMPLIIAGSLLCIAFFILAAIAWGILG